VAEAGDGGIDGIISRDRLGMDGVYVQGRRWPSPAGRPEVSGSYGVLAGQGAGRGVLITSSTFTPQAAEFARPVEGIVLGDGRRLAELRIDHQVGVTLRPVKVPKLGGEYFE
jgi:restriction system protein